MLKGVQLLKYKMLVIEVRSKKCALEQQTGIQYSVIGSSLNLETSNETFFIHFTEFEC